MLSPISGSSLPRRKRAINGILLLDKPHGYSSNQALQKVKWLFQAAKAGHTGTLDPLATGVLPICLGEATKFAQYLSDASKTYIATLRLGITTTTGDLEGEMIQETLSRIQQSDLEKLLPQFVGNIMQTPPMYSALKIDGKPLYEYAREGITLQRKAREVRIDSIRILDFQFPFAKLKVTCSKGTYIRTLAEDIGSALGLGAHLVDLQRTVTAKFSICNAVSLSTLEAMHFDQRDTLLLPVDAAVQMFPRIQLSPEEVLLFKQGQAVRQLALQGAQDGEVRVYAENDIFLGLGIPLADGRITPKRLVNL